MSIAHNMRIFPLQQKFGIKTAGLDDKCTAMQMLVVYAKDLKEGFIDYAEPVSLLIFIFILSTLSSLGIKDNGPSSEVLLS